MTNPYINYYLQQSGSGISHFRSVRSQRGEGFFSKILQSAIIPLMRFAGKDLMKATLGVAEDAMGGKDLKQSAKRRFTEAGRELGSEAIKRAKKMVSQDGAGRPKKAPATGKGSLEMKQKMARLRSLRSNKGSSKAKPKPVVSKAAKKKKVADKPIRSKKCDEKKKPKAKPKKPVTKRPVKKTPKPLKDNTFFPF
jgi:hypothetical protein